MESGKADNPLNLALSTPEDVRERSIDLNTGFEEQTKRWELIVKYHGNLEELAGQIGFDAVPLLNSYAVITIDERKIPTLLASELMEFVEKPNRMFFELEQSAAASCLPVFIDGAGLSGAGTLVGIIDSGIDYAHQDFRNNDGTTRIALLWDQTIPDGVFTEEQINEALNAGSVAERLRIVPSTDV